MKNDTWANVDVLDRLNMKGADEATVTAATEWIATHASNVGEATKALKKLEESKLPSNLKYKGILKFLERKPGMGGPMQAIVRRRLFEMLPEKVQQYDRRALKFKINEMDDPSGTGWKAAKDRLERLPESDVKYTVYLPTKMEKVGGKIGELQSKGKKEEAAELTNAFFIADAAQRDGDDKPMEELYKLLFGKDRG